MTPSYLPAVAPPNGPDPHDDRIEECQAAIADAFRAFVSHCEAAGWSDDDVAIALTEMADEHFRSIGFRRLKTSP